jgi:hypothetical protein
VKNQIAEKFRKAIIGWVRMLIVKKTRSMIISWVMMLTGIGKIIDEEPMILVPEGSGKRWKLTLFQVSRGDRLEGEPCSTIMLFKGSSIIILQLFSSRMLLNSS